MFDATDMTTPVTRGELREELQRLEARVAQATKADLEKLEGKLEARFAQMATKADLEIWGGALLAEIGRHTRAMQEALSVQVSVVDDKYTDLPGRVSHLEAALLPPKLR